LSKAEPRIWMSIKKNNCKIADSPIRDQKKLGPINQKLKRTLILLIVIIIAQALFIEQVKAYDQIKPYEPQIINAGDIPNRGPYSNPVPKEYRCYLEEGHKYHIFLVGDWITNNTDATDYDIEVRNPSNVVISINTESAGLPEQVANDQKHQYFVPAQSGDYRFLIYNDPKDSDGDDAAVFMIIEHLKMNTRYSTTLTGKPNVGAVYPPGYKVGYEFNTSEPEFLLYIQVPDPEPVKGITGLDMYEARVYPMANPFIGEGYLIQNLGVPFGDLLNGLPSGSYGGFNTEIEGFRFSDMRISCESAGVDMRKKFTSPMSNGTEEDNVFYYMSLLAEYFEGEIEFYMKTDYRAVNMTLIDPPEVGYTGDTTIIKVEAESATKVDSMWLEYSTDSWKTKKTITLIEKPDYWLAALPSFELHDLVQYKIYAEDEIDNRGLYTGSFTVMNKVELDFGISGSVVQGGQTVKLTGAATRPSINLVLNIEQGGTTQKINIQTDGEGVFSYDYKPTKIGEHDVTISYAGDEDYHSAVSREKSFRVDKRKLDLTCELGAAPYKNERTLTITGQVTPSVSGLAVEIMFVSPENSFVETVSTGREGGFSLTITPEVIGTWDMLPQLKVSELYDASQGSLISFEVENLTPVDIIVYKAMAFTTPPLMYVPIGLTAALVAVLLMRTGFVKKRLNKEDEEEEAASEEETLKGATGYKRRSSR
jgi:hypothetical protein